MSCGNVFGGWFSGIFCGLNYNASYSSWNPMTPCSDHPLQRSRNTFTNNKCLSLTPSNSIDQHKKYSDWSVVLEPPKSSHPVQTQPFPTTHQYLHASSTLRRGSFSSLPGNLYEDAPSPFHLNSTAKTARQTIMFSKIGSALQAAADVVAPPCARVDDLRYHWSQVVDACQKSQGPSPFIDNAIVGDPGISATLNNPISTVQPNYVEVAVQNSSVASASGSCTSGATEMPNGLMQPPPIYGCGIRASMVPAVEETHVPRHLGHMLRILVGEDHGGWGSLSPCLEFLVTERVLLSLASFAWCDRPLGIRQHAYIFLSSVLNHLHHSHLHHARIHKPLQSMVRASSEMNASPYEAQEMDYLTALCEKIRQDHSLVLLYIQPTVMESPPCHYTPDEGFTTGSSEGAVAVAPSSSLSAPFQASPSHSLQSNSEPSNCPTPRQDLSNSSPSKKTDHNQVEVINLDEKQSCGSSSSHVTDSKFQHRRTSSSHSISSTHSSDSSTRCSSVSSTPLSLVSGSSAWTLTRGPRHVGLQSSFPLVDALLNLCHSADTSISTAAHECLLLLCAVRESVCGKTIARHTLYPHYVASRVAECIAAAPSDIDPVLVEDLTLPKEGAKTYTDRAAAAASGAEVSSSDSEDNDSTATDEAEEDFQGRRELLKMLHWLAYCDKVVCASDSVLSTSLCHCLREIVLAGEVRPLMTSTSPEVVSFSLALLSRLLTSLTAHSLVMSIVKWLCSGTGPSCDEASGYEEGVLPLLLELCRDSGHQVQALRLLQTVVESSCGGGAALLTSTWLEQRRYFDSSAAEVQQDCWSDEEDERARKRQAQDALSPGSQPISRTFAPNNINRIVKQFLSLVPEELQSNGSDDFESYKSDAIRQCRDMARISSLHQWGREATSHPLDIHNHGDTSSLCSRESPPEEDRALGCSLGPFLDMLLDLLEKLPEQEYDVNLQVTCVISSLGLLPLPHLHEFLLNPSLPVAAGTRTPYTVLRAVVVALAEHVLAAPDYRQHLKLARHQLLGAINTWEIERDDEDRKFEALIVIEEFCKELASIAHAKYTVEVEG